MVAFCGGIQIEEESVSMKSDELIKDCPSCNGTGVSLDPFEQFKDGICRMCNGNKRINMSKVCSCGRPANQVRHGYMICSSIDCNAKVDEALKKDKKVLSAEELKAQMDDDQLSLFAWLGM